MASQILNKSRVCLKFILKNALHLPDEDTSYGWRWLFG
jgi:hypothetical protein